MAEQPNFEEEEVRSKTVKKQESREILTGEISSDSPSKDKQEISASSSKQSKKKPKNFSYSCSLSFVKAIELGCPNQFYLLLYVIHSKIFERNLFSPILI